MRTSYLKRKNKTIIITVVAILTLLVGASALAYTQKWWPFTESKNYIIDGINYGPPTQEEIENSQNTKKDILEEDKQSEGNSSNGSNGNLRKVSIGVSHADIYNNNVEVRAFIDGVVEGTGTCTATLTQVGAQTVTQSSKAFVDASTSQCEPILIPLNKFEKNGNWILIVTYKSPTSQGESEKITVNI